MEKYFIVTEKSQLRNEYIKYYENHKRVKEIIKGFFKDNNIEAEKCGTLDNTLYIAPTENDKKRFANQLSKRNKYDDLIAFKRNSEIGRKWIKTLKDNNLKPLSRPFVPFYIEVYGKTWTRLFHYKDTVYCSIETEGEEFPTPEGFIEIKASEFYEIMEEAIAEETQKGVEA